MLQSVLHFIIEASLYGMGFTFFYVACISENIARYLSFIGALACIVSGGLF